MATYTYVNGIRIAYLEDGYHVRKNDTEVICTDTFDEALKLANIIAFHKDGETWSNRHEI